jgi:hypothetical protein
MTNHFTATKDETTDITVPQWIMQQYMKKKYPSYYIWVHRDKHAWKEVTN